MISEHNTIQEYQKRTKTENNSLNDIAKEQKSQMIFFISKKIDLESCKHTAYKEGEHKNAQTEN